MAALCSFTLAFLKAAEAEAGAKPSHAAYIRFLALPDCSIPTALAIAAA